MMGVGDLERLLDLMGDSEISLGGGGGLPLGGLGGGGVSPLLGPAAPWSTA